MARAEPEVLAGKNLKLIADHTADVIGKLDKKPAVMGHDGRAARPADRGPRAVGRHGRDRPRPVSRRAALPFSALKSASPVLKNPANRGKAVTLTFDQFKYGWANALSDEEAKQLYDTYHVAAPGSP